MWQLKSPFPRRTMLYIHAHCVGPVRSSEIKGRRHYVWGFYTNNTYERGPRVEGMQAERAPFPWRLDLETCRELIPWSVTSLLFFSIPGNYFLTISHSCKFEKDEFSRILVSGVCLLIFMKVIIYSYERWWDMVASKLFGQIDFEDYYIVLRWIRGILPSYWILILRID